MPTSLLRFVSLTSLAMSTLLFVACTSVPISSMYSLSKIDPMKADPGQIRVAIRTNEAVNVTRDGAHIAMSFKAEDHDINEAFEFDVQLTSSPTLTPKLIRGLQPDEQVTVMSLAPEDARTMRDFQQRLFSYEADGIKGRGSFTLGLGNLCLDKPLPQGDIPLTLFLKTETNEDYIVFIKTELREAFSDIDSEFDVLGLCQEAAVGHDQA